jgi:CBS domain-containing protein
MTPELEKWGIAPKELIKSDFQRLVKFEHLATTEEIGNLLFIQSMEGRAHNGVGAFRKRHWVNTTINDVVRALGLDPALIKKKRQALIDDVVEFVQDTIKGTKRTKLVNKQGEPFLGVPFLGTFTVDPHEVLKGLYIGGLRDNSDIRKEVEKKYKITIGGGSCYLVDVHVMQKMGLDGEVFAHMAHENKIEEYKKKGLIVIPKEGEKIDESRLKYMYIRDRIGPGHSDDAAIISAGLLFNLSVALGVALSDAIDTLEKYVPTYQDQDDEIAFFIKENYARLGVSMEDVYDVTYLATIIEEKEDIIPDSSLRYLLSLHHRSKISALENHLNFIQGLAVLPVELGHARIDSRKFYSYIKQRVFEYKAKAVPLTVAGLERPIEELMNRELTFVLPGTPLKKAIETMLLAKAELLLVVDKDKKTLGVVHAQDILPHLVSSKSDYKKN